MLQNTFKLLHRSIVHIYCTDDCSLGNWSGKMLTEFPSISKFLSIDPYDT